MTKLLMLDLDGTIREPKSGATFINTPEDQQIIPAASAAIKRYCSDSWATVGITNQGGVAAGHKSLSDAMAEQKFTLELLPQLQSIYFCPDFDGTTVYRVTTSGFDANKTGYHPQSKLHKELWERVHGKLRKPGEGMLVLAMDWFEISSIDCLYVGDRPEDEQAAQAAGVEFMWAKDWY